MYVVNDLLADQTYLQYFGYATSTIYYKRTIGQTTYFTLNNVNRLNAFSSTSSSVYSFISFSSNNLPRYNHAIISTVDIYTATPPITLPDQFGYVPLSALFGVSKMFFRITLSNIYYEDDNDGVLQFANIDDFYVSMRISEIGTQGGNSNFIYRQYYTTNIRYSINSSFTDTSLNDGASYASQYPYQFDLALNLLDPYPLTEYYRFEIQTNFIYPDANVTVGSNFYFSESINAYYTLSEVTPGYQTGYNNGYHNGYDRGKQDGINSSQSLSSGNILQGFDEFMSAVSDTANHLFEIKLMNTPQIQLTIGDICSIPLVFILVTAIIKILRS